MIIIAIIPKKTTAPTKPRRYLVEMTGKELDKINGIADTSHFPDRYKEDTVVKVAVIYDKLQELKDKMANLPTMKAELQNAISAIDNASAIFP